MNLDLTFKSVCETIKKQGKSDTKLIDGVDQLLGLAMICSPVVLGPTAAAILPTLAVKNELTKIGKSVFEKLTKKKDEEYVLRHETMRTAYGLLVFTSFFDALDFRLAPALRSEIKLLGNEKVSLAKEAIEKVKSKNKHDVAIDDIYDAPVSNWPFAFPHPTETLADQRQRQVKLWKQMTKGFVDFVQKLAFWGGADEKKKARLLAGLDKVDADAAERFEAQYFELARKYEDFAVWANLQAHKNTKALIDGLSDYVKNHAKLCTTSEKAIDVGFSKLREAVLSIPETLRIKQAKEIAASLNAHYQARINEPIIEDKETDEGDKPRLSFPKVAEAFVPQAFRVLRQSSKSRRLEEESTWSGFPRRNDLGAFLLSYLSSPYSTEAPLLVLGHPGSGKSLLTTIMSARLTSRHFTAIRVPLREVNADADIVSQIEDAIRRVTGVSFDSWIKLSSLFKNCPPIVILDGYDELLQASGQVFASYIKDAQRFQEREAEQGRPLRVIITSRVTLIDKAAVPVGATIVRLLEFDHKQRECWCAIWNKTNAGYFRDAGIEKFALPSETESGAGGILSLAEQPLLLLMLALYDSQQNQLRASKGLDRTKLYDSLLRRFVIRERGKEKGFSDAKQKEQEKALTTEMQRLGVAALGMYNRRKVHILAPELDDDIAFFKLEREVIAKPGKALSQADLLLGSFFFVHKSKAQHISGAEETHEETAAFEFLHNTFGEFLAADFMLRRAIAQVQSLRAAESNEALRSLLEKMMGTADGLERDWFASLVYTPLFTRPVIMEMIREWAPHVLKENVLSNEEFVASLEKIILNQVKRLLNKREMPQIMRKETAQEGYRVPFGDHPLIGHIAIYSINLILLRLITGKQPFVFDESDIASHEDGTRPWDRLMYIWRSWFALANLNGLTAVMLASRKSSILTVSAKSKFLAEEAKSKLEECHNVAVSLGDNVAAGVTGLFLFDPTTDSPEKLASLEERLGSEGFDLGLAISVAKLQVLARRFPDAEQEFAKYGKIAVEQTFRSTRRDQTNYICIVIVRAFEQNLNGGLRAAKLTRVFRNIFQPDFVAEIAVREPRCAQIIFALSRQLHDYEWIYEFARSFFDDMFHRMAPLESDGFASVQPFEWVRLFREIGAIGDVSRFTGRRGLHPEHFDRIFHPRRLLEIIDRNPDAGLAYIRIMRELGGVRDFERYVDGEMGNEFLKHTFHPHRLLEKVERNPEVAVTYLQILRELRGGRTFEMFIASGMGLDPVDRLVDASHVLALSDSNPEAAIAYLQLVKELSGGRDLDRFSESHIGPELFGRLFHPRRILEMSDLNPEGAIAALQLLRDLAGEQGFEKSVASELALELFSRLFHPRHIVDLSERNPKVALAYLQLMRELDGGRYFQTFLDSGMAPELFNRLLRPRSLMERSEWQLSTFAFWLACGRQYQSPRLTQALTEALMDAVRHGLDARHIFSLLPISSLPDLRWLVDESDIPELRAALAETEIQGGP